MSDYLNKKQKEAVESGKGPLIVLAGAGSGKTRVLVSKVIHMVNQENVSPYKIVMITFTNKAALEMKKRIREKLPKNFKGLGFIGTFHSFCALVLRKFGKCIKIENNFVIYDSKDQKQLVRGILKKMNIKKNTPGYFINRISKAKNLLVTPKNFLKSFSYYDASLIKEVYMEYEKALQKNKALDFDDLLMKAVKLFFKNKEILSRYQQRYEYFLIDEFQDTNYSQYLLAKLLANKNQNITIVGDFSQSIYSWRGADIGNLERFKDDFPNTRTIYLEENYRSTQKILQFAYDVISKNSTHPILELFTKNNEGENVVEYESEDQEGEAKYVLEEIQRYKLDFSLSSFAILYRTNAQSRIFEEAFLNNSLPYSLIGGIRFYERKEIKDVLAYLRLIVNPIEEISKKRILKLGKRRWNNFKEIYDGLKKEIDKITTVELIEKIFNATGYLNFYNKKIEADLSRLENIRELKSVAINFPDLVGFLQQVSLVESEYFLKEKKGHDQEGVKLMTLHQAKGLEFPVVFIVGVEEGILPHSRSIDNQYQLEEERRLFYVGITRAKKRLYIIHAKERYIFGRRAMSMRSRFLEEIDEY